MAKQGDLLKKYKSAYGGEDREKRAQRSRPRPLATRSTMHLVLRSSLAKKDWSFLKKKCEIQEIAEKFARTHFVKIISMANVGNHLHFQIQLHSRHTYKKFIRAFTGAIMMEITGFSRWKKTTIKKFWDYRPFTRIVQGYKDFLNLRDYIGINQLEGFGYKRGEAEFIVKWSSA